MTGFLLNRWQLTWVSKIILMLIWALLFVLGLEVGSNDMITRSLGTLGAEALLLGLMTTLGSTAMASTLWKLIVRKTDKDNAAAAPEATGDKTGNNGANIRKGLQGSLIIVGFFAIGVVVGLMDWIPSGNPSLGRISTTVLFTLMFCVGITIGNDRNTLRSFTTISPLMALLPLMTILGTWLGAILCAPILDKRSIIDCLAVGSGLGYYSLSSVIITSARGADLGTIALLSNIIREIITLVCAPLLMRIFGRLAPIAAAGSTSADTTLPVISRICGKDLAVVSIYHGFVTDFLVPFMVTFFCAL